MDEESIQYSNRIFDAIENAARSLGMDLTRQDPAETRVPSGILSLTNSAGNRVLETSCLVIPTHVDEISTLFIQLAIPVADFNPEQETLMEQFASHANRQFLLGTLLTLDGSLYLKYVMALEPDEEEFPETHFQSALFAFCRHADAFARLSHSVLSGEMTVDQALSSGANQ